MRNGRYRTVIAAAVALAAGLAAWPGPAAGQSLAETARQEEARRKAIKKPGKVYTNGSLRSAPGEVIPTPAGPKRDDGAAPPATDEGQPGGQPPTPPAAAEPAEDPRGSREAWKQKFDLATQDRDNNALMIEALQSRINALLTDFTARDDPAQRAVIAADRQKALEEFERRRKLQVELEKALADVEEAARRAGVPPGWLR
jgi:hypothetical protein